MEADILDELFVDKDEPVDKALLVETLKPFVRIGTKGDLFFTDEFDRLNSNLKALVYLVSKKAQVLKDILDEESEASGPKEISVNTGIGESSAKKALAIRFKKILLKVEGGHIVPNYNLRKVRDLVIENE